MSSNPFPIPRRVAATCAWIARGSHVAIPPLAGLVLGWLVFALTTPIYTSTITFFPPSAASNGMSGVVNQLNALSVLSGSTQSKTLAEQYVSMLKSRSVADAMSAKFDLPHVYGKTLPEDVRRTIAQRTGIYMSSRSELIEVSVDDTDRQRVAKMASYYIDATPLIVDSETKGQNFSLDLQKLTFTGLDPDGQVISLSNISCGHVHE